jgi:hypothetical protein
MGEECVLAVREGASLVNSVAARKRSQQGMIGEDTFDKNGELKGGKRK